MFVCVSVLSKLCEISKSILHLIRGLVFFPFFAILPFNFLPGGESILQFFGVFLLPSGVVFQFFLEMAGDESLEIWLTMVAVVAMDAMVLMDAMIE